MSITAQRVLVSPYVICSAAGHDCGRRGLQNQIFSDNKGESYHMMNWHPYTHRFQSEIFH